MTREKVFVDVGAHNGSTAINVLESDYPFDRIVSVEPDPDMVEFLTKRFEGFIASGQYVVAPAGLSNTAATVKLYGDNTGGGASIVAEKFPAHRRPEKTISLITWGDFLDQYGLREADLYVKINCEGAEIGIVESMLEHDAGNIASMVIDYDIIKSPFGGWKKWRSIKALRASPIPFELSERVFVKKSGRPFLDNWLGALRELRDPPLERIPPNGAQVARIKYLEVVSALGIRLDIFKKRKKTPPSPPPAPD